MSSERTGERPSGLHFSPWNLLLVIPFLILFTPLYNRAEPELFGMPFFYWAQFTAIAVGVLCTVIVYRMTRKKPAVPARTEPKDVDDLDEGSAL